MALVLPLLHFGIFAGTGNADNNPEDEDVLNVTKAETELPSSVLLNYTNRESIDIIKDFCVRELNLNEAAASGVVANMTAESGLRTTALGDGGTSYGLCQWHNERWEALRTFADSLEKPQDDIEAQLYFFKSELQGSYSNVYRSLLNVPNSEKGAFDAGYIICVDYENPADSSEKGNYRGAWAVSDYRTGYNALNEDITLLKVLYMLNIRVNTVTDVYHLVPAGGYATVESISAIEYDESWWRAENCLEEKAEWLEDGFENTVFDTENDWDFIPEPEITDAAKIAENTYIEKESKNDNVQ